MLNFNAIDIPKHKNVKGSSMLIKTHILVKLSFCQFYGKFSTKIRNLTPAPSHIKPPLAQNATKTIIPSKFFQKYNQKVLARKKTYLTTTSTFNDTFKIHEQRNCCPNFLKSNIYAVN